MNKLEQKFKNRLKRNEPMSKHTTFKIGGPAKYFLEVQSGEELIEAVGLAKADGLDYAVIGKGSNLLVSDKGFDGLIIRMSDAGCQMPDVRCRRTEFRLTVGAGLNLRELAQFAMENGLMGLEWAYGIPGTVGGAAVMNAGCFGHGMRDVITKVKFFNSRVCAFDNANPQIISNKTSNISNNKHNKLIKEINNRQCKFGYRESVFKKNPEWIILEVELELKKGDKKEIKKKMREYSEQRSQKLPLEPSAGSIFKKYEIKSGEKLNPKLEKILKKEHPEFLQGKYIPAGWLIEELGLKGKKIGGAQVSEKHANFIVNTDRATAEQVIMLISLIKQKVRNYFRVQLQEEVMYLGF